MTTMMPTTTECIICGRTNIKSSDYCYECLDHLNIQRELPKGRSNTKWKYMNVYKTVNHGMSANVCKITDSLEKQDGFFTQRTTRGRYRIVMNQIQYLKNEMYDVKWQLEEHNGRWYKTAILNDQLETYKKKNDFDDLEDEQIIKIMVKDKEFMSEN